MQLDNQVLLEDVINSVCTCQIQLTCYIHYYFVTVSIALLLAILSSFYYIFYFVLWDVHICHVYLILNINLCKFIFVARECSN